MYIYIKKEKKKKKKRANSLIVPDMAQLYMLTRSNKHVMTILHRFFGICRYVCRAIVAVCIPCSNMDLYSLNHLQRLNIHAHIVLSDQICLKIWWHVNYFADISTLQPYVL